MNRIGSKPCKMLAIHSDIHNYREPKKVLDFTRSVWGFTKGLNGVILFIILLPLFVPVILFYIPLSLWGLSSVHRISSKLLTATKEGVKTLDYNDARNFYAKIKITLASLQNVYRESDEVNFWLLRPLNKKLKLITANFLEIEKIMQSILFVDTSKEEYTEEEKTMFAELSTFFGENDAYQKDTFQQLKKESA